MWVQVLVGGEGRERGKLHKAAVFKSSKAHPWEEEGRCSVNPGYGKKSNKREVKTISWGLHAHKVAKRSWVPFRSFFKKYTDGVSTTDLRFPRIDNGTIDWPDGRDYTIWQCIQI
jgi:hypothetical protein